MRNQKKLTIVLGVAATFSFQAATAQQRAWDTEINMQGATGICRTPSNASESPLVFRPLSIDNGSGGNVFLNCAPVRDSATALDSLTVYFLNYGSAATTISCTAIFGDEGTPSIVFLSKNITIAANAAGSIHWTKADNGNVNLRGSMVSYQCLLPTSSKMKAASVNTLKALPIF